MRYFVYNDRVEALAGAARSAKTNEELLFACRKLDIADLIVLGDSVGWLAKHALSAVYRSLKKFPALRTYMNYFGTLDGFTKNKDLIIRSLRTGFDLGDLGMIRTGMDTIAMKSRDIENRNGLAMAFFVGGSYSFGGILISEKNLNQEDALKKIKHGEVAGFHPQGCNSFRYIMEHEIGHILDLMLGIGKSREYKNFIGRFSSEQIRSGLSSYCVSGTSVTDFEIIAEAYAEFCLNPKPRLIATTIGNMINAKYRATYRY